MSPRLPVRLLAAQTDRRLLELIAGGHERAFEALVHRYRRPLLSYCARMGLSPALCEDVVQLAFLQAWIALERGTDVRQARPWLYRIVHNAAVNTVRRGAVEHRPLLDAAAVAISPPGRDDPEQRLAMRETLSDVAALPQMQREAIVLSAIDGRSHEEVASALGVTDGAVRGLLYRARVALRDAAAALTPAPLIGWASGAASRMTPSAARVAAVTAPGADGPVTLIKGVAVAATAALAAGAVIGPLQPRRAHRRVPAAAAAAVAPGTSRPRPQSSLRLEAAVTPASPAASTRPAVRVDARVAHPGVGGIPSGESRGSRSFGPRRPGSAGSPLPGPTEPSNGPSLAPAPASVSSVPDPATSTDSTTPAAPPPPPPPAGPPAGGSSGEPAPPSNSGGESEAARERAEREAETARETREREAEVAREAREREEAAAREKREREASASGATDK